MRKFLGIVMAGLFVFFLLGCETMRGAGKDLENAGENVQETVEKND